MAIAAVEGIEIQPLRDFSPEFALEIGALRAEAFENKTIEPANEAYLQNLIESPEREQFVARIAGNLVGAATVNLMVQPWKMKSYLDFFMVSDAVRGRGVGHGLFVAVCDWSIEKGATQMNWTSEYSRKAAHAFYLAHQAEIRNTAYFGIGFSPES